MRKDACDSGIISEGGCNVRFSVERKSYHRFYINAVVSMSYVRVGKKVRLSILSMFSKMRIFCGKFLKRLGWANWICSCVISTIVGDIAGSRFKSDA